MWPDSPRVVIGAGARGNHVFAEMMRTRDTGWEVAAVVEPDDFRGNAFRERHGLAEDRAFQSVEALLSGPTIADFAFICTPDPTHFDVCAAVSAAGYDVLLEKPIATSLPDCLALLEVHRTSANQIYVAHVLRYSPFFRAIRALLRSGQYGGVRSLHLSEMIGHWHFAHSYVRGNWRRRDESAPIVLTKSSHDLDIITWLMPQERVVRVSSAGSLARPFIVPLETLGDPHGGGDLALLRALHAHLQNGSNADVMTSLESSITSHVLAFLADDSRLQGGVPLPMPAIFEGAWSGGPGDRRTVER